MTPEQMRIKIAEACGWQWVTLRQQEGLRDDVRGYPPGKECVGLNEQYIPDYLNDLNAMHEAEKTLSYDTYQQFVIQLFNVCGWRMCHPDDKICIGNTYRAIQATAAQRAEAFLKTLSLWTE